MSDYTELVQNIIKSVKDTPFVFDLIDDPIVINAQDIFDITSFQEDLVSAFKYECIEIEPQEIINIINLDVCDPVRDSWEEIEDDVFFMGDGTKQLNCSPSEKLPSFTDRIIYDPYKGSGRRFSTPTKQWDKQERPKTPLLFENPEDILYPESPKQPNPPPYKETFEHFITNGLLGENGKFKGKIPTPLQYFISIKIKEAIKLYKKSIKNDLTCIVATKKSKPTQLKKHFICKHGSECKHHKQGHCIFAHSFEEWCPTACQHGEHCWNFGVQSGFKNNCKWWHKGEESKIDYYRRTHNNNNK